MRTLGISRDSPWTHIAWMQALDLTVGLLSDWNGEAVRGLRRGAGLPGHAGRRTADRVPDRSRRRGAGRVELRERRGAGLRRAPGRRPGLVVACAVFAIAAVVATEPAIAHVATQFMAGGAPGNGEAAPGDHLQSDYRLWLAGHQLEHGRAPWIDPYSFQPEAGSQVNAAWWPFGLPYWPLDRLLGSVAAWNLFTLLALFAAGLLAMLWLLELELSLLAAAAGGLAFEIAPYRVMQSRGHLLGPTSLLLALALWAFERARATGPLVVVGDLVAGARLDPPVRPGPSRARGDPFLCPLRAVPVDRAERRRGNRRRSDRGRSRGRADPTDRHRRLDRLGRAVARRGARVLGDRARLPLAAHPARRRGVRLPRVADAAARDRRTRLAAHGTRAAACGGAGNRRGRAGAAGSRHPLPAVLAALARVLAAALSARTGAADADRVPLPGRAARDRDRLGRAAARGAADAGDSRSARSSRSSCSPTCTSVPSIPPRPTGPTPPTRP